MFYLTRFWCSTLHLMKSAQHCLCNSGVKVDILDTCGAMICSYFGIAFLLFFIKIKNALYISCQNSTLLFINGLIFDIINTQNKQSLEFEWKLMLAPLRSVNDQRLSWLFNVFLKLFQDWLNVVQNSHGFLMFSLSYSKIGCMLFRNAKEIFILKEMLARKVLYRGTANIWKIENKS